MPVLFKTLKQIKQSLSKVDKLTAVQLERKMQTMTAYKKRAITQEKAFKKKHDFFLDLEENAPRFVFINPLDALEFISYVNSLEYNVVQLKLIKELIEDSMYVMKKRLKELNLPKASKPKRKGKSKRKY